MNALVAVRSNFTGSLSASRQQREQAQQQANSIQRADLLGKLTKASTLAKAEEVSRAVNQELDRDAFLQLLMFQMQNQDPLEPIDNSEMIAQLAQFSSLEQMNNVNENIEFMSGNIDQLNFISANSLLGRQISGIGMDGLPISGTVERVQLDGSTVVLTVSGQLMSMAGVLTIE